VLNSGLKNGTMKEIDKICKKIYSLAKKVQENFKSFYLAGGTALMLKHKHRISVDIDFFNERYFSKRRISQKIRKIFKVIKEEEGVDNIDFFIENTKISFVYFPFKNIESLENSRDIKIASDYDIFLNKIYAAGRRIELKDPIDFAFLYQKYRWSKEKVKKDFNKKFPEQDFELYLGAILNIEDYTGLDKRTKNILKQIEKKWT